MRIILASQSPRRSAILDLAKIDFEVLPSKYEKPIGKGVNIEEESKEISYEKALEVFNNTQGDRAIISADTIVVKDGIIYGKPKNREDAIKTLEELQNSEHTVYTSFAILIEDHGNYEEYKEIVETKVKISSMSTEEIVDYVDSEEPFDKAGSYAIQSSFCKFIEEINGNYMSVIGLPIDRVYKILRENGII